MKAFGFEHHLIDSYARFSRSFSTIRSDDLKSEIDRQYDAGRFWPDGLLSLNPRYLQGPTADDLVASGDLDEATGRLFRFGATPIRFYRHQAQSIAKARAGQSYVVTTGTGSGKSLCFFVPIVDAIIRARKAGRARRTSAIIVYPMNALANSQIKEIDKFISQSGLPTELRPVVRRYGEDADALIKAADIALHTAKATDQSFYLFFESKMEERLVAREELKVDLTAALANNELEIEYQPSVDLRTGAVTNFEALLRWRHPLKGMMPPSEFIPIAEETGLIVPIGDWVLYQACREAMHWPASVAVAVNVSSAQFSGRLFALRVAEVLAKSGLSPQRLELEITETLLLSGSDETQRNLRDLRQLGLKIALDDFGTGYSSLSYLQQFPFDRIKIDRSFVTELATRPASRTLVRAVIELGHSLDMRITAEGIETDEQLDRVSAKGCDEAQGFLFSRSVPPQEVLALITRIEASSKTPMGATG